MVVIPATDEPVRRPVMSLRGPWQKNKQVWTRNRTIYPKINWGTRLEKGQVKTLQNFMWLGFV